MTRLRSFSALAICLLALTFGAANIAAKTTKVSKGGPASPVADCQAHQGNLTRHYTSKELARALKALPASTKEYTTCYGVISDQLNQQLGGGSLINRSNTQGSTSSGGGSGTVIIIVVIVVVVLLGGGGAFYAYRRNQREGGPEA